MKAKPMKTLEFHCAMNQFWIKYNVIPLPTIFRFTRLSVALSPLLVSSNATLATDRRRGIGTGSFTLFEAASTLYTTPAPGSKLAPSSVYCNKSTTYTKSKPIREGIPKPQVYDRVEITQVQVDDALCTSPAPSPHEHGASHLRKNLNYRYQPS